MSMPTSKLATGRGAVSLALCGLLGIVIGLTAGLNIARRMVPPATESRLVMQLLEVEQAAMNTSAAAGKCDPLPSERMQLLLALVDLVPISMRDTLVVDVAFEREVQRLRVATRALAEPGDASDCGRRRRALHEIDTACRECHRVFRSGG